MIDTSNQTLSLSFIQSASINDTKIENVQLIRRITLKGNTSQLKWISNMF